MQHRENCEGYRGEREKRSQGLEAQRLFPPNGTMCGATGKSEL